MLKNLFSEGKIGDLVIANRLVVPAMVTNYCNEDGTASEEYIAYHEAKAKGGWGLIITEDYVVDPAGKGFSCVAGLWGDHQIESHSELTKRIHKYDSKIFAQIYHCGRQTTSKSNGNRKIVAPSALACPKTGSMPFELTVEEIKTIVRQFGDTAERAVKCGFDGIEIHGGHGYLIQQFLSSYSNRRVDMYGGPLTNRTRFLQEIIKEVRSRVGRSFPVIVRLSAKEFMPGGLGIGDTRAIAMMLESWGVDGLHISVGTYGDNSNVPSMHTAHAWIVDFAEEIKKVVSIPVITVGRINDPFIADGVIASGKADFVAMGRASIADPDFPNKAKNGEYQNIRYCIACMQGCTGQLHSDKPIGCLVNPLIGRQSILDAEKVSTPKNVFVIGGGPAGIEAAIGAAVRGHKVTLVEKRDRLGGLFEYAGLPLAKGEFESYPSWAAGELERLNVEVKYNFEVNDKTITDLNPDAVILAVGGVPFVPPIPGIDNNKVVSATDVLAGREKVGQNVVVAGGGLVGVETASFLGYYGKNVTLVEMLPEITYDMTSAIKYHTQKHLVDYGVNIQCGTKIISIDDEGVYMEDCSNEKIKIKCDNVCLALGYRSNTELFEKLKGKIENVFLIGDAKKPHNALDATSEGYLAGLSIQ